MVLVKKKDGTLQLCVDYWHLNGLSEGDAYPMPRVDELIDRVGKTQVHLSIGPYSWLLAGSSCQG